MRNHILITGAKPAVDCTYVVLVEGFDADEVLSFAQEHCVVDEDVEVAIVNEQDEMTFIKERPNA